MRTTFTTSSHTRSDRLIQQLSCVIGRSSTTLTDNSDAKSRDYSREYGFESFCRLQLVFPDSHDAKASAYKLTTMLGGPIGVSLQFGQPVLPISRRNRTATRRTLVPETTINKYSKAFMHKHEVRHAGHISRVQNPTADSLSYQRGPKPPFSRPIASRPNQAHSPTALCAGEGIHSRFTNQWATVQ
jgi:hypothetical protein